MVSIELTVLNKGIILNSFQVKEKIYEYERIFRQNKETKLTLHIQTLISPASFKGGVSTIIQDVIGKTMTFQDLKNIFTSAGVNLFPEDDAFCYAEGRKIFSNNFCLNFEDHFKGTCEKHYVMESHLYDCMSAIALTHNFTWSRWNFLSGRRSCVLLMREIIENRKTVRQFRFIS